MIARRALLGLMIAVFATSVHASDKPTIGVSFASDTNPFYVAIKRGVDARAKEIGVNVVYVTANEVVSQQINGIQDLIARKVDALLVSPIDTSAIAGAYEMAGRAGIPVVSMVRFSNSPHEKRAVTMDWKGLGAEIGDWTAAKVGGKGKVAMIAGPSGAQLFRDLATGFRGSIAKHPGMSVVFNKDVALTRESGLKQAEDALQSHPDLAVIYGANDDIALGAAQAVAAAGKAGQIVVTGLAVKAVKDGNVSLTYDLNAAGWGAVGLDTAVAYARGQVPTDAEIKVQYKRIDPSTVDEFLAPKVSR
jgi:ribose transport system substrate-binding protein